MRESGEVVVTITDTGIGIAPEMLGAIFDMFVQERQSIARSQGGLGLGLSLARSITAMHGGSLTAHSAGRGRAARAAGPRRQARRALGLWAGE